MAWFEDRILEKKKNEDEICRKAYESLEREISEEKFNQGPDEDNTGRVYGRLPDEKITVSKLIKFGFGGIPTKNYVKLVVAIIMASVFAALVPLLIKYALDIPDTSNDVKMIVGFGFAMIGSVIMQSVFGAFRDYVSEGVLIEGQARIEGAVMQRVLDLPISFFKNYSSGDLAARVIGVGMIFNLFSTSVLTTVMGFTVVPAYFIQMFVYTPELVLPAVVTIAVLIMLLVYQGRLIFNYYREAVKYQTIDSGMTFSLIKGIQKLKMCGSENLAFAKWLEVYAKEAGIVHMPPMSMRMLPAVGAAVTVLGTIWTSRNALSAGLDVSSYYSFQYAFGIVLSFLTVSFTLLDLVAMSSQQFELIKPVIETTPEIEKELPKVDKLHGDIQISNVKFRYSNDSPILFNKLNIHIKKGEYVAIVGKTGCGKSTLIRLLLGFEKPEVGAIYYDNNDLSKVNADSVRRNIGVVLQDGQLFADNIKSNITVGGASGAAEKAKEGYIRGDILNNIVINSNDKSEAQAWEAAEIAGIANDIKSMPMGMHTIICEGSGGISGGQRQRILIARAVANKPSILIFDEATSALDNITQKKISDTLAQMHCTRLVVAHRLSTIRDCDRIFVLDGGCIVQEGKYDELLEQGGLFGELVANQLLEKEVG